MTVPSINNAVQHAKLDYTKFYSHIAKRLRPSAIRSLYPLASKPGMLSLFAGLPNPTVFPISNIQFTLNDGTLLQFSETEIKEALQYGPTQGSPKLVELWKNILIHEHKPVYNNSDLTVLVGSGSQDICCKTIDCYCNAEDNVIVDTYSYPGAVQHFQTVGVNLIGIDNDSDGMIVEQLQSKLEQLYSSGQTVKAMYLIPTGSNPTGVTISHERRIAIYKLASKYNTLIFEDDPYVHMQFSATKAPANDNDFHRPASIPSFFSMDVDGRVIRFDSLSKTYSAGLRIGFAVAPSEYIKPVMLMQSGTNLFSAGPTQIIVQLILERQGLDGFNRHVDKVALFYARRRDLFYSHVKKYLVDTELVEVNVPIAGMFLWMKINKYALHKDGVLTYDSYDLILKEALAVNVLLTPGKGFHYELDATTDYVRASFSLIPESDMEEAVKRLAKLLTDRINEYHRIHNTQKPTATDEQKQQSVTA